MDEGFTVFVTDVRFKNEAEWIRINGGTLVNISRSGYPPANHEEHRQYHFMKAFLIIILLGIHTQTKVWKSAMNISYPF